MEPLAVLELLYFMCTWEKQSQFNFLDISNFLVLPPKHCFGNNFLHFAAASEGPLSFRSPLRRSTSLSPEDVPRRFCL